MAIVAMFRPALSRFCLAVRSRDRITRDFGTRHISNAASQHMRSNQSIHDLQDFTTPRPGFDVPDNKTPWSGRRHDPRQPKTPRPPKEQWQIQKAALDTKFKGQVWSPRKRISPDALSGMRTLHESQPTVYTTQVLADHFKISVEAVRRILKSKWRPADEAESEDRRRRWERRGEKKWTEMVELGLRPPKKWRDLGVGRVSGKDQQPAWKKPRESARQTDAIPFADSGDVESPSIDRKNTNSEPGIQKADMEPDAWTKHTRSNHILR